MLAVRRVVFALCALALSAGTVLGQVESAYLYTLSNFAGRLRYDWVRVTVDQERTEVYIIYQDLVRIFNASGMEIFSFGDDLDLGHIVDLAVDEKGDIILLSYKGTDYLLTRCNFRGIALGTITIKNMPEGLQFQPNRLIRRNGLYYLVSLLKSTAVIVDSDWEFQRSVDLLGALEPDDKKKGETETIGFAVDQQGNLLITLPTLFKVYKYSTDGTVSSFGKPGSAAGRFGVIAGIAVDSHGNLLVADKLKCVIMVFDKNFNFIREFGYRGPRPENLIIPDDIAIDSSDRIYVSQGRRRGVSVFALTYPAP